MLATCCLPSGRILFVTNYNAEGDSKPHVDVSLYLSLLLFWVE